MIKSSIQIRYQPIQKGSIFTDDDNNSLSQFREVVYDVQPPRKRNFPIIIEQITDKSDSNLLFYYLSRLYT